MTVAELAQLALFLLEAAMEPTTLFVDLARHVLTVLFLLEAVMVSLTECVELVKPASLDLSTEEAAMARWTGFACHSVRQVAIGSPPSLG